MDKRYVIGRLNYKLNSPRQIFADSRLKRGADDDAHMIAEQLEDCYDEDLPMEEE